PLHGIGFVGAGRNQDAAAENTACGVVQNAAVKLATVAMRLSMINQGVVVDMAAAVHVIKSIEQAFAMLAIKAGGDVVACQARTEGHRVRVEYRAFLLKYVSGAQVKRLVIFLLQ